MALNSASPQEAAPSPHPIPAGGSEAKDGLKADLMSVVRASLDDMKAEDVVEIDLAGKTSIADAMIVATGRSDRHVGAIADRLVKDLKDNGFGTPRVEGVPACDWVLIDSGDVIAHIFRPEVRSFYNLEKMWGADRPAEPAKG